MYARSTRVYVESLEEETTDLITVVALGLPKLSATLFLIMFAQLRWNRAEKVWRLAPRKQTSSLVARACSKYNMRICIYIYG